MMENHEHIEVPSGLQEEITAIGNESGIDAEWLFTLADKREEAKEAAMKAFGYDSDETTRTQGLAELRAMGFDTEIVTSINQRRDFDNPLSVNQSIDTLINDWGRRNYHKKEAQGEIHE